MKIKITVVALTSALVLSGCGVGRVQMTTTFDPSSMAFAAAPGTGSVIGQAYFRQASGAVVTPSVSPIYLIPVTAYTTEFFGHISPDRTTAPDISNLDQRVAAYVKRTAAAPGGAFAFYAVPPGQYYLLTVVQTETPAIISGYNPGERALIGRVSVEDGQSVHADLTQ